MAIIITTPAAGVSPYETADTTPIVLRASADGTTLTNTVAADATTSINTSVYVAGQTALNSLITSSTPGVFQGANVNITLEEQNFNTTNQVTSNTNYPSGNIGEVQYNSGSTSFASDPYFTYSNSNIITPGIRTNNYLYANGQAFIGSGSGNGQVGGFDTQIQFNDSGNFGGATGFTFNKTSNVLNVPGNVSASYFSGNGSLLTGIVSTWANLSNKNNSLGPTMVALGFEAGYISQGANSIAVGDQAGQDTQGANAVAVGTEAGFSDQGAYAIAIGQLAGQITQGQLSVAIGDQAGQTNQGQTAIAIGPGAGQTNQGNNTIIINASGTPLNQTTANTFTVSPVRNDTANINEIVFYNTTSKEITYGSTLSVIGNVTGSYILGNGSQLSSITGGNVSGAVAFATTANAVAGANVSGEVAFAATANAVAGANVSGEVAFAATANAVAGANVSGSVASANAVAGANVSGEVAFAATANAVAGANVSGEVSFAATANAVAGANVSGQVANALIAGTVYTNAQPNITSVGILSSLSITGNLTSGNANLGNAATATYFIGNGSLLTNITGGNVSGAVAFATTANAVAGANVSGEVAFAATANAVAGANVSGAVSFATTANAVAGANVSGQVANALVAGTVYTNAQPNITSVGILSSLSVTGNISNSNVITANTFSLTSGNLSIINSISGSAYSGIQSTDGIPMGLTTSNTNGVLSIGWLADAANVSAGYASVTVNPASSTGNVVISGVETGGTGNIASWTFDPFSDGTGNMVFPTGAHITSDGGGGTRMSLNSNVANIGLRISAGNTNAFTAIGWSEIEIPGTGNSAAMAFNTPVSRGNVQVITGNLSATNYRWTFDNIGVQSSPVLTVDVLPAATTSGLRTFVSDANLVAATNFGAIVGNAGGHVVPVYSDGTNWRIG